LYGKDTSNGNKITLGTAIQKICNDYKKRIIKANIVIRYYGIQYLKKKKKHEDDEQIGKHTSRVLLYSVRD
jgi:hypothetical protein